MGANPTQALGVVLFFCAFTALAGGIAGGGVVWYLLGLALLVASVIFFRKCKPWENADD